ncbi:MAG: hypothetical protein EU542_09185 [Promethearchaeota archaeon]|nr:MAG: hypothetical protein EU542_09185 [Candidatus Lokiarchaeota archaeon]
MANVKDKIFAELDNIERVLIELKKAKNRKTKELVVLVGIGAFLQNIYTGMENIIKQFLLHQNIPIPESSTWHKDLLNLAVERNIISKKTYDRIGKYLVFRHFFAHAYGFLIDEKKLKPLMEDISKDYSEFKGEINQYLLKLKE